MNVLLTFQLVVNHVLLPVLFAFWLTDRRYVPIFRTRTHIEALLLYAAVAAFFLFILVCGAWHIVGYWLRPVLAGLLLWATVDFFLKLKAAPRGPVTRGALLKSGFYALIAAAFTPMAGAGLIGRIAPDEAIDLAFPLAGGVYAIGQGGANAMVNYHAAYAPQAYALDIIKLNAFGFRARGLMPDDPARYEIFGADILSPCDGRVAFARDGLDDARGAQKEPDKPAGNMVALDCGGATVLLAHMMKGSVRVAEGDTVAAGDALGRVGNSGNTTEPHLHIHAEKGPFKGESPDNQGLAMRFSGRFLVRGDLVRAR